MFHPQNPCSFFTLRDKFGLLQHAPQIHSLAITAMSYDKTALTKDVQDYLKKWPLDSKPGNLKAFKTWHCIVA